MTSLSFKRICLAAITLAFTAGVGCELLVDFDRTKIPGGGIDGSVDSPGFDVNPLPDTGGGGDARADVTADAPAGDTGTDGGDATTTSDASDGSTSDADDGGSDADDSG